MSLDWDDVRTHFAHDEGWFCDAIVPSADAKLRDLLDLIRQRGWAYEYAEDGARRRLPPYDDIKQAQHQRAPLLTFWPGGTLPLNVHFFDEAFETTFDPRNIHGQEDLDALVAYMRVLGRHFGSPVAVTVESRTWSCCATSRTTIVRFASQRRRARCRCPTMQKRPLRPAGKRPHCGMSGILLAVD